MSYFHETNVVLVQLQQEFEPGTVPKNAKLMTGMSSSHDIAHAARPRTISPGKTRFRSDARATEPSLKPWGFGVGHGMHRLYHCKSQFRQ